MKDPYRDMPRAIYISIPIVTVIYVMTNIAYFTVISPSEVAQSDAVAVVCLDSTYFDWSLSQLFKIISNHNYFYKILFLLI